ncbi:MAG: hypothetical protein KDK08_05425 [Rhizobiaceae bacterium]|nr:hypothetical protein [Rhizobiaceae bacterium]MCC0000910.1 hypothetical protein [Methylobacteriaceae bacterium]
MLSKSRRPVILAYVVAGLVVASVACMAFLPLFVSQPITPMQGVIAFAITAASFGLVTLLDHLVLNPKGH